MPSHSPTSVKGLSEVITAVDCSTLAIGKAGKEAVKRMLQKHVVKGLEVLHERHGEMKVVDGKLDKRDTRVEAEIRGATDLLQGLGYEKASVYTTVAGKLGTVLTSSVAGSDPSVGISVLTWMLPYCREAAVRPFFNTIICSLLSTASFPVASLPQPITDELLAHTLHGLPLNARVKLYATHEPRLIQDIQCAMEKFKELGGFPWEAQVEAVTSYASRLGAYGDEAVVPVKKRELQDLVAPFNEVWRFSKAAAHTMQAACHASAQTAWCPAFYFLLCYEQCTVLQLVLEVCESVFGIDSPGFTEIPGRLRNHTGGLDLGKVGVCGMETTQALRVPYVIAGLHCAALHVAYHDSMNNRLTFTLLHKLMCKAYDSTCAEQQHMHFIKQGPAALPTLTPDDPLLVNTAWYTVLSLLSLLPSALATIETYLKHLAPIRCAGSDDCTSFFVTTIGHLVCRARPSAVNAASLAAKYILINEPTSARAQFLYDSCVEMMAKEDLPEDVAKLAP
eukprot:TRINITY_DN12373_c0_g1_i1.p1 TRINITY_DN12373_c0_g1~~TRINITY_DN12373_c0_g1_i1.p1  ORF type:complete len:523 (+),score=127.46 TRINITY_DN12373_c0_g1_i1:53-1570(+)